MQKPSDEILVAYLDGALDWQTRGEVEAWIEHDAALRDRLLSLAMSAGLLRAAFDPVLHEPVPERLLAAARGKTLPAVRSLVGNGKKHGPRYFAGRPWTHWAAAAGVAAVEGFGGAASLRAGRGETPVAGPAGVLGPGGPAQPAVTDSGGGLALDSRPVRIGRKVYQCSAAGGADECLLLRVGPFLRGYERGRLRRKLLREIYYPLARRLPIRDQILLMSYAGKQTGDKALATALDFVRAIRKTPIVVNDSRGFYANRCVINYLLEGHLMLIEGIPAAMIENVARMAGMPQAVVLRANEIMHHLEQERTQTGLTEAGDMPTEFDDVLAGLDAQPKTSAQPKPRATTAVASQSARM